MQNAVLDLHTLPTTGLSQVHPPPWIFEVGPPIVDAPHTEELLRSHRAQVRGYEVELYSRARAQTRSGSSSSLSLRLVDLGEWRIGGYVRWNLEKHFPKFEILDELDEKLRLHFPPGSGTIHRADLPISIPSVRLSSTR